MIRLFQEKDTDVYWNLAMEHVLVTQANQHKQISIRIWRNQPSVIIGRNQALEIEVDTNYCNLNDIEICRRISGGGAVYHDFGNYNTTFVLPIVPKKPKYADIKEIGITVTNFQVDVLKKLGYDKIEIKNNTNILYQGRKISGSAGYYFKSWYLHHSTLLVDADLEQLEKSLLVKDDIPDDKKRSKYAPTINLGDIDPNLWGSELAKLISEDFHDEYKIINYSDEEKNMAKELENKMYRNSDWIKNGKRIM